MTDQQRLLFVYAHPDDENGVAGTMVRYLNADARIALLCTTRGERGEIAPGVDATSDNLGMVREGELRNSMNILGVNDVRFLDYVDSGMAGTTENEHPDAFINVPTDLAVESIVRVIRNFRPQVVVTFDETGIYFHPDHLAVHRLTVSAFNTAADANSFPHAGEAWKPSRLFYSVVPRSGIKRLAELMQQVAPDMERPGFDLERMGYPDENITLTFDSSEYMDLKERSLLAHASQMSPDSPMRQMPPDMVALWRGREYYALAAGEPMPPGYDGDDLFAGL